MIGKPNINNNFCLLLLDLVRSVSVYLSLLLSCALQVPQEKRKCVTKIISSIHFLFEAWNTSHDLEPSSNPVLTVTLGFLASRKVFSGLQKIGQVTPDSQHTLSSTCVQLLDPSLLPTEPQTSSNSKTVCSEDDLSI